MTPDLIIRPAKIADIPRIETLHFIAVEAHRRREEGFNHLPSIEGFSAAIRSPDGARRVAVAERRGQFAGYVAWTILGSYFKGRSLVLGDLSVLPQHRGHGIGGHLLAAALSQAPRRTSHAIASVWPNNVAARDILRRTGFEPFEIPGAPIGYRKRL
ncbi:GNAT family N-acetyltransferase [Maritimibacter sp. DP1N21-5]|uniref:GNAT family N-acetyltransferase n=1 Tax=Maritimibacter sp. DP1N21-5 TaxID=2836867 RepID=UPI001C472D89|nr:N-acetyltransferase [Maritimibacter sp. DP1N21-5]MBV7409281.1 GNAT family N-acetyltransferase [Maritimibacter sp. DP1N21-5]